MPRSMERSLGDGGMALLGMLGLSFDDYGEGWAGATWVPTDLACNPLGTVHGGVLGVIHDAAVNFAANSALESGDRVATLDLSMSALRAAQSGDQLTVRGEVVRLTRRIAFVESRIFDATGELVSTAAATCMLRRREAS